MALASSILVMFGLQRNLDIEIDIDKDIKIHMDIRH